MSDGRGKWIWLPSQRTLANTVCQFRRDFDLEEVPGLASIWITADSRYRLWCNGQRVQWGPAPFDPRHAERDPADLTPFLRPGRNTVGVEVLFFGHAEGTWPFGSPGLLIDPDEGDLPLATNESWNVRIDRSRPAGRHRRWYLRSLQEAVDFREHDSGWCQPEGSFTRAYPARVLGDGGQPSVRTGYGDYATDIVRPRPEDTSLADRQIPLMQETIIEGQWSTVETLRWRVPPADWFENRVPNPAEVVRAWQPGDWTMVRANWDRIRIGFPRIRVIAPPGTRGYWTIAEAHEPSEQPLADHQFFAWSEFTCGTGVTEFEAMDYDAGQTLQVMVEAPPERVQFLHVGLRDRQYAWPEIPTLTVDDPIYQQVIDANLNTLRNSAQDSIVDGMARERQQYAGDGSQQLEWTRLLFGDIRLSERFLRVFGQGQWRDGMFSDSWPGADRLMRKWQTAVGVSFWGSLVDHGVGYVHDLVRHTEHTGDWSLLEELAPRVDDFGRFLLTIWDGHEFWPPEGGEYRVWMDHDAYPAEAGRKLAFQTYIAYVADQWLTLLHGSDVSSGPWERVYEHALTAVGGYRTEDGALAADGAFDDRTLAMALGLPGSLLLNERSLRAHLRSTPNRSYPANAHWPYQVLASDEEVDWMRDEIHQRWHPMASIARGTIQEHWRAETDSRSLMSHCATAPIAGLIRAVVGFRLTSVGGGSFALRPHLGGLNRVRVVLHVLAGPIDITIHRHEGGLVGEIRKPSTVAFDREQSRADVDWRLE